MYIRYNKQTYKVVYADINKPINKNDNKYEVVSSTENVPKSLDKLYFVNGKLVKLD